MDETNARTEGDGPLGSLILRAIALLVILDLWAVHHFGFGVRNLIVPAGIAAAFGSAVKVAGFVWDEATVRARLQELVRPIRPFLTRLVTRGFVTGLAAFVGVLLISVSSITVIDGTGDGATVGLSDGERAGEPRRHDVPSGGSTRFPVLTTPFGRVVRLDATGYVGGTFTVYPPIGRRVELGRDLASLPSVLFRPGAEALSYLADGAEFRVLRADGSVVASETGHAGSFLLGRPRGVTSELLGDWTRSLEAAGVPAPAVSGIVNAWKQPRRLDATGPLSAGEVLRAEVRADTTLVAVTEIALDGVGLIDALVERVR